ncbi:MAG: hypothetical protein GY913_08800 [Proteobacteria bacterium]|nr:hypothetical protein [Pseudomonadota bacterium]MCP4917009.1 hypothetical protein [Pseudomonadota bacterium]
MLLFVLPAFASEAPDEGPDFDPYLLAQVQATVFDMDEAAQGDPAGYGDPEDDMGFKVRRGRVGGSLTDETGRLSGSVIVGVSSGFDAFSSRDEGVQLIEAAMHAQANDLIGIDVGLTKVPYGRENLFSSSQLTFQERTVQANHLAPFREVGAVVDIQKSGARVRIGAFNGNNSLFGDDDPGLLTTARAEYTLGDGDAYSTYGTVEGLTLGVGGDFLYNMEYATSTMGYGGDVIVRAGGLSLLLDGHAESIKPTASDITAPGVLAQTMRWGAGGQLGYTVNDTWEPAARFEIFDEDTSTSDNNDVMLGTFGVTSHWWDDHFRLGAGYVLRLERGGTAVSNDSARLWTQVSF